MSLNCFIIAIMEQFKCKGKPSNPYNLCFLSNLPIGRTHKIDVYIPIEYQEVSSGTQECNKVKVLKERGLSI